MRKILIIIAVLFSFVLKAQPPVQRSNSTFTAVDTYLRASKSFGVPIYSDTANYSGLDSLGILVYVTGEGMYLRDTLPGLHYWALQNTGASGVASFKGRTGAVVPLTGDYNVAKITGLQDSLNTRVDSIWSFNDSTFKYLLGGVIYSIEIKGGVNGGGATGITTLNTLTAATQFFAVGSSGTAPSWSVSGGNTHSINLPTTSASNTGLVTPTLYNLWTAKQDAITGAATTILTSNLTSNRAVISNGSGKIDISAVTSTELGYLSGATSNLQTQINTITDKAFNTLTDGATVTYDYSLGFNAQLTIGGNRNISITNMSEGDYATIFITQDATGGRDITFTAGTFLLDGIGTGTTVDLTDTPNALDILTIVKRGSVLYVTSGYFHN